VLLEGGAPITATECRHDQAFEATRTFQPMSGDRRAALRLDRQAPGLARRGHGAGPVAGAADRLTVTA